MAKDKKAPAPAPIKSKDARIKANKKRRIMKDADRKIKDAKKKVMHGAARKARRAKIDFTKKEGE